MLEGLYGNPHSASTSSQTTTQAVENIRHDVLHFFHANPRDFDVIFVANATAGIKLVAEALNANEGSFWYGYHQDSHTSLVGVREAAREHKCFTSDQEVEAWIEDIECPHSSPMRLSEEVGSDIDTSSSDGTQESQDNQASTAPSSLESVGFDQGRKPSPTTAIELFAYPAQSNMNGRRLPLDWCRRIRQSSSTTSYRRLTLLDAAAFVSTSPLDLSDPVVAPDFTVLSFYKIFGFPDLGALIVRKDSADVLLQRKYFGGGTVDMVLCQREQWHVRKTDSVHAALEDGTLPIHSILALRPALNVHERFYGSMARVSKHVTWLFESLHKALAVLRHFNGQPVAQIYDDRGTQSGNTQLQGPILAFNLRNSHGEYMSTNEVQKLAGIRNVHIRNGGLCNPGGVADASWCHEHSQRCGAFRGFCC